MSIVVTLTTPSQGPCHVRCQGCLMALRLIAMAFLVAFERLLLWAFWHLTMMTLIASIAIGNGFKCIHPNWRCWCCLLLLVTIATSSDAHVSFAVTFFTILLNKLKGNHHSMINSFYFIALISNRLIDLDRGLFFAVDWSNQVSQIKPFHTRYFLTIKQTISSKPRQWFWWLSWNQRQSNQDLLLVSSQPQSSGLGCTLLQKLLLCNL